MLILMSAVACVSGTPTQAPDSRPEARLVMAPGESQRVLDHTIVFEAVLEDSRCPTGVTCIREGDAAVRIRVSGANASATAYTLRTGGPGAREVTHGGVLVRLVDVAPYPAANTTTRPDEYPGDIPDPEKVNAMRSATARRLVFGALAAVVIAVGVFGDRARAQQPAGSVRVANFDIRAEPKDAAAGYLARVAPDATFTASLASARAAGIARLQAEYAALDVENSPLLGTIEIVGTRPGSGFLTGPSADRVAALRGFLAGHADAYGVSPGQAQSLELVADYVNPAGNMAWVELEQRINGLPVFQGFVRGGFTRNGELARVTGPLASGLDGVALPASPALGAARAVFLAAAHVGWPVAESDLVPKSVDAAGHVTFDRGSMADDAKASLVYFPLAPGVARLAWSAEIWGDPDVFLVVIDALDGTVLFRKNLTNYQTQAATYTVYNDDSPAPMSPTTTLPGSGTQAPFIGRTTLLSDRQRTTEHVQQPGLDDRRHEPDRREQRAGRHRPGRLRRR